mgnify:CR=1 FL=1
MPNPKNVLIISPPADDSPGKYAVVVSRGMGQPTILFADSIRYNKWDYELVAGRQIVARFPLATPYTMVLRKYTTLLTAVEAAQLHKAEHDELEKLFGTEEKAASTVEEMSPGGYL